MPTLCLLHSCRFFFNVRTYIYCPWTPFSCCLVSPLSVSPWPSPICSIQCMTVISIEEKYQSQVVHSSICQAPVKLPFYLYMPHTYCNGIELKLIIKRHGKRPSCLHYVETNNHPCFGIASKCYISQVSSFSF